MTPWCFKFIFQFHSDYNFWHGLSRVIQSRNAQSSGKTYLMRFDVDAELNIFKALKKAQKYKGASHADDLFYLFTTKYHDMPAADSKEFMTIRRMVGIFTSFAISGDPNCEEVGHLTIKPFDGSKEWKCINITENEVAEVTLPNSENIEVWNSIYEENNSPLY